jgi:hypothetical protein
MKKQELLKIKLKKIGFSLEGNELKIQLSGPEGRVRLELEANPEKTGDALEEAIFRTIGYLLGALHNANVARVAASAETEKGTE